MLLFPTKNVNFLGFKLILDVWSMIKTILGPFFNIFHARNMISEGGHLHLMMFANKNMHFWSGR